MVSPKELIFTRKYCDSYPVKFSFSFPLTFLRGYFFLLRGPEEIPIFALLSLFFSHNNPFKMSLFKLTSFVSCLCGMSNYIF
jgi:hypothetical protein